jgi:hypothetical protein
MNPGTSLTDAIRAWVRAWLDQSSPERTALSTTPCARDSKGATLYASGLRHSPGLPDQQIAWAGSMFSPDAQTYVRPNVLFVEWLMGAEQGSTIPSHTAPTESASLATQCTQLKQATPFTA